MVSVVFPRTPDVFNRKEEQVFRDHVGRTFSGMLSKSELPSYPGFQGSVAKGTSATFAVPSGAAPLYIPMETINFDASDPSFATSPHKLKAPYSGFAMITWAIDNVSSGSGSVLSDVTFSIYKNGASVDSNTFALNTTNAWRYTGFAYMNLAKNDEITLYVAHNKGSNFTFNLQKSTLGMIMLTPNPTYRDRSRA